MMGNTIFCCHELYSNEAVAIKKEKKEEPQDDVLPENVEGKNHPLSPTKKEWDFLDKEKDIEAI